MTFDEAPMNPAELAAMTESAPVKRTKKAGRSVIATQGQCASELIAEGQGMVDSHVSHADRNINANGEARMSSPPKLTAPLVSDPIAGHGEPVTLCIDAGNPIPHAARDSTQPTQGAPHEEFPPYDPTPNQDTIDKIISLHRLRQGMIKAQMKLKLQAMASIRFAVHEDGDYDTDESKAKARKKADALYRTIEGDPSHSLYGNIMPYLAALEPLDAQRAAYEKELVKAAKQLPVYEWAKSVKGLGDVSFATIVGECGDIGTYKSISAVWKRLGLAVFDGNRQGAPGEGASKEDWITHGYNKQRRSVSWNARNNLIGGMGKYRPLLGEDVQANPDLTYLQKVFVERARYESEKLGLPVTESDKGKESYKKHPTNRAMRYTEKRMLRELYKAWRRS